MKNTILSLFALIAISLGLASCSSQSTAEGKWKLVKVEHFAENDVITSAQVYNDDEEAIIYEFTAGNCTITRIDDNYDYGYNDYEDDDSESYETIWDGDNVILLDEDGDVQDAFTVLSSFPSSTLQLGNGYTVYTFEKVD
jgi:hypothetical protein